MAAPFFGPCEVYIIPALQLPFSDAHARRPVIMQFRIYVMYQSKKVALALGIFFVAEVVSASAILGLVYSTLTSTLFSTGILHLASLYINMFQRAQARSLALSSTCLPSPQGSRTRTGSRLYALNSHCFSLRSALGSSTSLRCTRGARLGFSRSSSEIVSSISINTCSFFSCRP